MKIATVVVATKSYVIPLKACLRRIGAALREGLLENDEHKLFIVTDKDSEKTIRQITGKWDGAEVFSISVSENGEHYKNERQIMIARLQSAGFEAAREWGCDYIWSVEADVLVPANALLVSRQMLEFDNGYYGVAFVTYPSQGGGSFLGGHGTPHHPIAQDYLPEERNLPKRLELLWQASVKIVENKDTDSKRREKEHKRMQRLAKRIEKCQPKGNVFALNAKAWRRRGWLDNAWPGIGRGAVIQTDWTGLGCTLMGKEAANLAHFDGYDGGGTQDLFLNWHRWHPAGIRFCCITHTICDHVVRDANSKTGFTTLKAYHEPTGEAKGHLRYRRVEFHDYNL